MSFSLKSFTQSHNAQLDEVSISHWHGWTIQKPVPQKDLSLFVFFLLFRYYCLSANYTWVHKKPNVSNSRFDLQFCFDDDPLKGHNLKPNVHCHCLFFRNCHWWKHGTKIAINFFFLFYNLLSSLRALSTVWWEFSQRIVSGWYREPLFRSLFPYVWFNLLNWLNHFPKETIKVKKQSKTTFLSENRQRETKARIVFFFLELTTLSGNFHVCFYFMSLYRSLFFWYNY